MTKLVGAMPGFTRVDVVLVVKPGSNTFRGERGRSSVIHQRAVRNIRHK